MREWQGAAQAGGTMLGTAKIAPMPASKALSPVKPAATSTSVGAGSKAASATGAGWKTATSPTRSSTTSTNTSSNNNQGSKATSPSKSSNAKAGSPSNVKASNATGSRLAANPTGSKRNGSNNMAPTSTPKAPTRSGTTMATAAKTTTSTPRRSGTAAVKTPRHSGPNAPSRSSSAHGSKTGQGAAAAATVTKANNSNSNDKKGAVSSSPPLQKKTKKCYVCNPYTFWLCRDYPTASMLIGIALAVVVVFWIFYGLPVTEEQPCPLVETSHCNAAGELCARGNTDSCEEDRKCERIADRIALNNAHGTQMCGPTGFCSKCVNVEDSMCVDTRALLLFGGGGGDA